MHMCVYNNFISVTVYYAYAAQFLFQGRSGKIHTANISFEFKDIYVAI